MYNIVRTRELNANGIHSRRIGSAVGCCLLKLTFGMYSIVARCQSPRHGRIMDLITDEAWIKTVGEQTDATGRKSFALLDTIEKLRVASYPLYRADDMVCGVSAAYIHDLPLYRPPRGLIHAANPSRRWKSNDLSRTTRSIPEEDSVHIGKMMLTSPVRTALDLIGHLGEPEAFAALEKVLRRAVFGSDIRADDAARFGYPKNTGQLARTCIDEGFVPVVGRLSTGHRRAERLLASISPLSESYAESLCAYNLSILKISGFEQQADVFDGHRHIARVDFMHRASKTIIFVDGVTKYVDSGFSLMRKESAQYNRLIAMGYRIVRLSFAEAVDLESLATRLYGQAPWLRGADCV
ncbi:hypothetical protein [Brevibacterium sp. RIT 803]|uniref:hypothetical protein n=1 Tax=Brevibacterium sp. RIT 803 TaxID=2810210 RepID=UPI00194DB425|nr:hypothetical protein [Brevibacterium sp. RIT 803]MBM6591096.1 hypothetical protein [Brevibacterium sp. RIT 803]